MAYSSVHSSLDKEKAKRRFKKFHFSTFNTPFIFFFYIYRDLYFLSIWSSNLVRPNPKFNFNDNNNRVSIKRKR